MLVLVVVVLGSGGGGLGLGTMLFKLLPADGLALLELLLLLLLLVVVVVVVLLESSALVRCIVLYFCVSVLIAPANADVVELIVLLPFRLLLGV